MEISTISLDEVQPSQLYINQAKLFEIDNFSGSLDRKAIEPLPIKKFGQTIFFTDGHTRAFALWKRGRKEVKVFLDESKLDWGAYLVSLDWCQRAGVKQIGDLSARVISESDYQQLWLNRCQNMHEKIANNFASYIDLTEVSDSDQKSSICEMILRDLPEWFGIEKAIQEYIMKVKETYFISVSIGNTPLGFVAIKDLTEYSSEIYLLGVLKEFHKRGLGKRLIEKVEESLSQKKQKFLTVKTLSYSHPDNYYQKTRNFYQAVGFYPIEEFQTLWGEANPCLLMLKVLR